MTAAGSLPTGKRGLLRLGRQRVLPPLIKRPKKTVRTLTYEQFKSFMKGYRHSGGESSLQKSYAALVQLRRQRHRSWKEIEPKLRYLRESRPESRVLKAYGLPLTTRDWRRII